MPSLSFGSHRRQIAEFDPALLMLGRLGEQVNWLTSTGKRSVLWPFIETERNQSLKLNSMVLSFFRWLRATEKIDSRKLPECQSCAAMSPYHHYIRQLQPQFPHLEALSLYSEQCEKSRIAGNLGSHDSNSILAAEISQSDNVTYHRIDCYDPDDVAQHREILTGTGDGSSVRCRLLIIEDLSPAAIEILGSGFDLDPHIFYFHLGFDTRRSAMVDLIDPNRESTIPITWYMPSHAPEGLVSVPLPCDLKQFSARRVSKDLQVARTYSQQAYRPITTIPEPQESWDPPQRAFHRVSVISPTSTKIETGQFEHCCLDPRSHAC